MNKKANLFDVLYIIGFVFIIGFFSLIIIMIMDNINTEVQLSTDFPQVAKDLFANQRTQLPGMFDWWFGLFLIGLPLFSACLAYFNNIHPVMFWIGLPIILIAIFLGAAYSEVWKAAVADPSLASYANELPITNLVLTNYGKYSLLIALIVAFGTFVKLRGAPQRDVYGGFS